ncbi:MAG: bifunctional UDP-N-acetylmuramoyl-tripeptide:D-alanyl-D-alanine ligase/alanine racemase [Bacteroidia bacterium]|nr:bifunctional UDP-N-acetylmuramoyl-tripeptide:D-alanyl-D-alanine ligase/alanine racemase [Bacteroidia bacterium]
MKYHISQIGKIIDAHKTIINFDDIITNIYIDTRQINISNNALFVAIETNKNDGHQYLHNAYQKGIRNFIVTRLQDDFIKEDANYILVNNSIDALQKLAHYHRKQFHIPVIGITGSNGKTIVKEWLYFLLKDKYNICRSPKSFNSQIGVPLSVLNLNESHNLAIFEAGISLPREMSVLEKIISPDIAVFTHFGSAHSEGFENDEQKLNEKLKFFQRSKINIIQRTQNTFLQNKKFPNHFICISENTQDTVVVQTIQKERHSTKITINIENKNYTITIPFIDDASIRNAITCFTCIYYFDRSLIDTVISKMTDLPVISLRLEIKQGKLQSNLICDYYNSDIDSFKTALTYLQHYSPHYNKLIILSDFEETKDTEYIYHTAIHMIHQSQLTHIILIGEQWKNFIHLLKISYRHYLTTSDFINNLSSLSSLFFKTTILIKGSRKFEFEKIAEHLELKTHDTILEINIPALWNNLSYYKKLVGKNVRLMCMLKASGYGSGSTEMAFALQKFGIDYIAVAYTDEGVELKQADIQLPIMVMLPEKHSFRDIIQYHLEPEIYSFDILHSFLEELEKQGIEKYPVHIKIDTGMHRLGFLPDEIERLTEILSQTNLVVVKSIFSHLAASESNLHKDYTLKQIQLFKELSEQIETQLNYKIIKHISNSAAVSRFQQAHFDMIRLGIGMYGITDDTEEKKFLQNVLTLKTKIAQIKQLKKGESVGYNRNAILNRDSKIAVIPIGYADGFFRKLGNGNFQVKYKEHLINTVGNICMDMTMIDITDIENIQTNEEIIIFEHQDDIKRMSAVCDTIPYEILTSISQRVKRIYVYE